MNLENYNQQIGERMQDRDEELAACYSDLDKADNKLHKKNIIILVLIIAIILLCIPYIVRLAKFIAKMYAKVQTGGIL